MTTRPPMPYSGGKQTVARRIADLLPPHDLYVEPFAGGLSVLLAKEPARVEVVNDLNGDLVTFWRVLRDRPADLSRACWLTPHSRAEHIAARSLDTVDEVERARRVWVQLTQARGGKLAMNSGWRFVRQPSAMPLPSYLSGYIKRIEPAAARLRDVSLENADALDVIRTYDHPDAVMYVDPPYLAETRCRSQYAHEYLTPDQHTALLDVLTTAQARVALSGYDSPLYASALGGWHRTTLAARAMTGDPRTEVVWTNYEPEAMREAL